jgi:hypothetical protein
MITVYYVSNMDSSADNYPSNRYKFFIHESGGVIITDTVGLQVAYYSSHTRPRVEVKR